MTSPIPLTHIRWAFSDTPGTPTVVGALRGGQSFAHCVGVFVGVFGVVFFALI